MPLILGEQGAGLVVMLDRAGRTIAGLEDRVAELEEALVEERAERARLEEFLDRLRAEQPDTRHVDPSPPVPTDNERHDRPAEAATPV